MKKYLKGFTTLLILLLSLQLSAQHNNIQRYINKLKRDTLFTNSVTGIMVTDSKGRTVASWNGEMPLLTASTMKTISTALALEVLGPEYRFKTKIAHSGSVEDGVLYGDLYIVGGGDPTLGSPDTLGTPVELLFKGWSDAIKAYGIEQINGSIIADDRFFEREIVPSGWAWSNLGPYYGSGTSGLSFHENVQYLTLVPGKNEGDYLSIKRIFPQIPGMEYQNRLTTGAKESGNRYRYRVSDIAKTGLLMGTIAAGRDSTTITISNKFPHLSLAAEFQNHLMAEGIYSAPQILDALEVEAEECETLKTITETLSQPLHLIVNVTNRISNNFYAETLFKMVGKELTGSGSYDSSRVAAIRVIEQMGVNTKGYTQDDGSGLSRENYVSPKFFCNFYAAVEKREIFPYLFNSLPIPGHPSTLESVLKWVEPEVKEKIHAKSGSLSNVRCYAGFVEQKGGEYLYFAILSNNFAARTAQMQVGIEGFLHELAKY